MGLGLLWAYLENSQGKRRGYVVSNDNKLYIISGKVGDWSIIDGKGQGVRFRYINMALSAIYGSSGNKIAFVSGEGEMLTPNPITGISAKDIPVIDIDKHKAIEDFDDFLKSYYWGTFKGKDLHCIISADVTKYEVSAEFLSKTDVLENRRGKYLNIVGVDGEIALRAKQLRVYNKIPPYLNATDVINRMPVRGLNIEAVDATDADTKAVTIKPIHDGQVYKSAYIANSLKDYSGVTNNLKLYGQFGRYKAAIATMDFLLAPLDTDGIQYNSKRILSSFTKLRGMSEHVCRSSHFEQLLNMLNRAGFSQFLGKYLTSSTQDKVTWIETLLYKCNNFVFTDKNASIFEGSMKRGEAILNAYGFIDEYNSWKCCFDDYNKDLKLCLNNYVVPKLKEIYDDVDDSFKGFSRRFYHTVFQNYSKTSVFVEALRLWRNKLTVYDKAEIILTLCELPEKDLLHDDYYVQIHQNAHNVLEFFNCVDKTMSVYKYKVLKRLLSLCAFNVTGVSSNDGFSKIKYSVFSAAYRAYNCRVNNVDKEDGIMDFLYYINDNPYLAVTSLVNDSIIDCVVKIFDLCIRYNKKLYDCGVSGVTLRTAFKHSWNSYFNVYLEINNDCSLTNGQILNYILDTDNRSSRLYNMYHKTAITDLGYFFDELFVNYCLGIINQVFLQDNIKLSNARLRKVFTALCDSIGKDKLFMLCAYLRYKYFNVSVDYMTIYKYGVIEYKDGLYIGDIDAPASERSFRLKMRNVSINSRYFSKVELPEHITSDNSAVKKYATIFLNKAIIS